MARISTRSAITIVSVLLVLGTASVAAAQPQPMPFDISGSGSLLNTPPRFQGVITGGDMSGGFFSIEIDDTGWPIDNPGTPENERWDFLLATFFTYHDEQSGGPNWVGWFPLEGGLLPPVIWRFTNGADRLGGVIRYLNITILDTYPDGQVSQDELANQAVSANFHSHIEQSAGVYLGHCGIGSASGNLENFDPNMDDILTIGGTIYVRDYSCSVPVEETTWGAVKVLYQ